MPKKTHHEVIVVAIDHAKEQRISEFTPPLIILKSGVRDGKKYARFLADNLKPYIDKNFRTKPERRLLGIGEFNGGLIRAYAAWLVSEVYSKLMIMSPSLWVDRFDLKIWLY
ncbi:MAG: alpha/beta hydrolase-fold protein [Saprospiraceae bacterium]